MERDHLKIQAWVKTLKNYIFEDLFLGTGVLRWLPPQGQLEQGCIFFPLIETLLEASIHRRENHSVLQLAGSYLGISLQSY